MNEIYAVSESSSSASYGISDPDIYVIRGAASAGIQGIGDEEDD